jgi:hypothetical protein
VCSDVGLRSCGEFQRGFVVNGIEAVDGEDIVCLGEVWFMREGLLEVQ